MWAISSTVVVFPLVPVTAMNSFASIRQASSSSPSTGTPRSRAAAITGACGGTPGLLTTSRARGSWATPSAPACSSTPACRSSALAAGADVSTPITSPPAAASARAAAVPERASPATRKGPSGTGGRGVTRPSPNALAIYREADRSADRGDDPEAQDDLRLRPGAQLEVVMARSHQEDAFARGLEGDHLQRDRQGLDHEDPAQQHQQRLGLRHHREPRHRSAQAQ